jgi:hypothetical protein
MKTYEVRENWGIALPYLTSSLDKGEQFQPPAALSPKKEPKYPLGRKNLGPRAGLDTVGKISCPCQESNHSCPANLSLHQLSYPGSRAYLQICNCIASIAILWRHKRTRSKTKTPKVCQESIHTNPRQNTCYRTGWCSPNSNPVSLGPRHSSGG